MPTQPESALDSESPEGEKTINKDQIVRCALAIIDEQGLEALNMRKLASTFGVYPTAIYWYVKNKNTLLAEISSLVLQECMPPLHDGDWKCWIRQLFENYRAAVRMHPNMATLIGAHLMTNETPSLDLVETTLLMLKRAKFADANLVEAYNTVIAAMVGFVTIEYAQITPEPRSRAVSVRQRLDATDASTHPLVLEHRDALENKSFILRWENGVRVPLDSQWTEQNIGFRLIIERSDL